MSILWSSLLAVYRLGINKRRKCYTKDTQSITKIGSINVYEIIHVEHRQKDSSGWFISLRQKLSIAGMFSILSNNVLDLEVTNVHFKPLSINLVVAVVKAINESIHDAMLYAWWPQFHHIFFLSTT